MNENEQCMQQRHVAGVKAAAAMSHGCAEEYSCSLVSGTS
jgi:hypothetical protein